MSTKKILRRLLKSVQNPLGIVFISFLFGSLGGILQNYYFPKVFDKPQHALKASVCSPSKISANFFNAETGKTYPIEGGFPAPIYVSFENVGKDVLLDIALNVEFITEKKEFTLQEEGYSTIPPKGFGDVQIEKKSPFERVIKVPIFNPGDKFVYSAFGNYPVKTQAYSKTIGLSFFSEVPPSCNF